MKRLAISLIFLCLSAGLWAAPLDQYRIAVCADAIPAEHQAALELQEYIEKCTGAKLPIQEYDSTLEGPLVVVGQTPDALQALGMSSFQEFRRDEIALKSQGDRLYILGEHPRGTLYAAFEFLEKSLGVMWLAADATVTPQGDPRQEMPQWDFRYAPQIYIRSTSAQVNGHDPAFHAHLRNNGSYEPADERYGGCKDVSFMGAFCHSFQHLIPPEKYFASHPNWFAYRKGFYQKAGRKADAQLCLTNDDMREELVKNVLEELRAHPGYGMISISQNDNILYCQCKACRDFVEENGSLADLYLDMVNQVAEAVEEEFPDILVEMLAYRFTRHPPKTIRPRDNVVIRTCTIEAASFQTLQTPGPNQKLYDDLTGWAPLAKQMMVWDYVTLFRKYWQPHPNWDTLAPNMRFFRDCGVVSVFEQGPGNGGGRAADFPELRAWVLSKLMWNPDLDTWELIGQFLPAYYGPGAEYVDKVLRTLTSLAKGGDNCYTCTTKGWLPDEVLLELWLEGEELYRKLGDTPVYGSRILAATMPLSMSAAERHLPPPEPWTTDSYADELVRRLQLLGVTTLTEHPTTPGYSLQMWRGGL